MRAVDAFGAPVDARAVFALDAPATRLLDGKLSAAVELDPALPNGDALAAPGNQRRPRIVGGAEKFLAVWEDDRDGVPAVYGTRLDPQGNVLDRGGIRIASGPALSPQVTFDGSTFLVAWATGAQVLVASVDAELDPSLAVGEPKQVLATNSTVVGIAASANDFLVLTTTKPDDLLLASKGLESHFVDAGGTVVSTALGALPIGGDGSPGVAYCNGSYRIVAPLFAPEPGLAAFEVSPQDGIANIWNANLPTTFALSAAVACDDTNTLVVWEDDTNPNLPRILGTFVGSKPDEKIVFASNNQAQRGPRVAAYDGDFLVAWNQSSAFSKGIGSTVVDADGIVDSPEAASNLVGVDVGSNHALVPRAFSVYEPNGLLLGGGQSVGSDIYATSQLDDLSADSTRILVSTEPNRQSAVCIAPTDTGAVAIWRDTRNGPDRPTAALVTLDGDGLPIGNVLSFDDTATIATFDPVIASQSGNWLAAWGADDLELGDHALVLAQGHGSTVAAMSYPDDDFTHSFRHPAVAVTGDHFTVAYERGATVCSTTCSYVPAEIGLLRTPVDAGLKDVEIIEFNASVAEAPALASTSGNDALLVWVKNGDLQGAVLLGDALEVVPPSKPLVDLPGTQAHPAVAFQTNGTEGLLVWQNSDNAGRRIFAVRINAAAQALGQPLLVSGSLAGANPKVLVDGEKYLVAWEGSEAGGTNQVFGASVRFDGTLGDTTPARLSYGVPVPNAPEASLGVAAGPPSLARLPNGNVLLGYDVLVPKLGVHRAVAALLQSGVATGGACTMDRDCDGRRCVDGVCCASACNGPCERCAAKTGACEPVTSGADDACVLPAGPAACAADATCKLANGATCDGGAACASGFCVATGDGMGTCCESACSGSCDTCIAKGSEGTCTTRACGAFGCERSSTDAASVTCRMSCADSAECAQGYQCVSGDCMRPPPIESIEVGCSMAPAAPLSRSHTTAWLPFAAMLLAWPLRRQQRAKAR